MNQIKYAPTTSLKPHPLNATIYGDGCDQELLDSIKEKGIVNPILVTKSFQIISGHRRFNAAQMAELNEVPVIIMEQNDPLEIEELLIVTNKQRNKTAEQIAREYARLKEIEEEKAKKRMLAGKSDPVVNLPQGIEKGKSREIAAKKLGVSASNAERAAKVVSVVDSLLSEGKSEEAEELRTLLNEKSVNAAYQQIKPKKEPEFEVKRYINEDIEEVEEQEEYEEEDEPEQEEPEQEEIEDIEENDDEEYEELGEDAEIEAINNKIMQAMVMNLRAENGSQKEEIAKLLARIDELEKELESERFSLDFFRNISPVEYKKIKAENEAFRARIDKLEKTLAITQADYNNIQKKMEIIEKEKSDLASLIGKKNIEREVEAMRETFEAEAAQLNREKKELSEKNQYLKETNQNLVSNLEKINHPNTLAEITMLTAQNYDLEKENDSLKAENEEIKRLKAELEETKKKTESQSSSPISIISPISYRKIVEENTRLKEKIKKMKKKASQTQEGTEVDEVNEVKA